VAARGTRATEHLSRLGIAFTVHAYSHDKNAASYGEQAAAALGVEAERLFKTLVVTVDGTLAVAVVPVAGQLDTKAMAEAVGGKKAEMAEPADAERATGYVTGGISPIAQRKRLPVVVDATALHHQIVYCSAGQRGLQIALAPADLVTATEATIAPIGRACG
jgi:Cys-tRNA(Pro)/Cys-tRNA(Cys) deacylase